MKGKWKNNLDEMQEQEMLHIEKNCFWLLYVMLAAAMIVQLAVTGEHRMVAGEFVCFMVVSVIMVAQCLRHGIWDRHLKPDGRTNLFVSIIAGAGAVLAQAAIFYWKLSPAAAGISAVITFVITFVLCLTAMTFLTNFVKKKKQKLEKEDEDDD